MGERPAGWALADWVLSRYQTQEEKEAALAAYSLAGDAVLETISNGIESAMCKYNTKKPKKPKPPKEADEGAAE